MHQPFLKRLLARCSPYTATLLLHCLRMLRFEHLTPRLGRLIASLYRFDLREVMTYLQSAPRIFYALRTMLHHKLVTDAVPRINKRIAPRQLRPPIILVDEACNKYTLCKGAARFIYVRHAARVFDAMFANRGRFGSGDMLEESDHVDTYALRCLFRLLVHQPERTHLTVWKSLCEPMTCFACRQNTVSGEYLPYDERYKVRKSVAVPHTTYLYRSLPIKRYVRPEKYFCNRCIMVFMRRAPAHENDCPVNMHCLMRLPQNGNEEKEEDEEHGLRDIAVRYTPCRNLLFTQGLADMRDELDTRHPTYAKAWQLRIQQQYAADLAQTCRRGAFNHNDIDGTGDDGDDDVYPSNDDDDDSNADYIDNDGDDDVS